MLLLLLELITGLFLGSGLDHGVGVVVAVLLSCVGSVWLCVRQRACGGKEWVDEREGGELRKPACCPSPIRCARLKRDPRTLTTHARPSTSATTTTTTASTSTWCCWWWWFCGHSRMVKTRHFVLLSASSSPSSTSSTYHPKCHRPTHSTTPQPSQAKTHHACPVKPCKSTPNPRPARTQPAASLLHLRQAMPYPQRRSICTGAASAGARTGAVASIFIFCALGGLLFGWDIGKKQGRAGREGWWWRRKRGMSFD